MSLTLKQVDDYGTYHDEVTNRTGHIIDEPGGYITYEFVDDSEQLGHLRLKREDVTLLPKDISREVN